MRFSTLAYPLVLAALGCSTTVDPATGHPGPQRAATTRAPDRLAWWRDARFGLFVHWGLYATLEGEWQGERDYGEWIRHSAQIPRDEYARLTERFTAERFDAGRWADLAKAAGMRYVVITTKHHDGFCLWPSDQTDFDIASTPFGRDVMREIADAFRARGLRVCWYHSIMDWNHPDYLPRRPWETDRTTAGADFDRYVDYLHGQVTELLTRYGDIGVMWFDGEWEGTWDHARGLALYDLCRRLQPNVIVNNRVDKGRGGMAGMMTGPGYAGDFGTPEQEIPATGLPGADWETCMTMNRHWGWNRADTVWKSKQDLIRKLCDIASKGGNFLLNIGPQPDGAFPPLAVERLEAIAAWMAKHGDAIHGTTASPIDTPSFGRITAKAHGADTTLNLLVFDWPTDGRLLVENLGNDVRGARLVTTGTTLAAVRDGSSIVVTGLPATAPDADCTVIELELEGRPIAYTAPAIDAGADVFLDELEIRIAASSPGLQVRFTTDGSPPSRDAPEATAPIRIARTTTIRAQSFHRGAPVGPLAERHFERVTPRPAAGVDPTALAPGLLRTAYPGRFATVADFVDASPDGAPVPVPAIGVTDDPTREDVGLRFDGYLEVMADAIYTISLASDDGSRLWIGDDPVVDNDGLHGTVVRSGTVALAAGWHPLRIAWFNRSGSAELDVRIAPVGSAPAPIGPARLAHAR